MVKGAESVFGTQRFAISAALLLLVLFGALGLWQLVKPALQPDTGVPPTNLLAQKSFGSTHQTEGATAVVSGMVPIGSAVAAVTQDTPAKTAAADVLPLYPGSVALADVRSKQIKTCEQSHVNLLAQAGCPAELVSERVFTYLTQDGPETVHQFYRTWFQQDNWTPVVSPGDPRFSEAGQKMAVYLSQAGQMSVSVITMRTAAGQRLIVLRVLQ
ncbi:MAG: hypothetical protein QGG60_11105 [Anaerolineales bacterium]|nr:hypothetical protein [Dehalococcoidales bacterium]MDP7645229.1 hypothetical protein [Anaerolineales bacterium]HJO33510.1 hypothetical protein [Anaerolineales bacterium]